jgi:hypothetical protein
MRRVQASLVRASARLGQSASHLRLDVGCRVLLGALLSNLADLDPQTRYTTEGPGGFEGVVRKD